MDYFLSSDLFYPRLQSAASLDNMNRLVASVGDGVVDDDAQELPATTRKIVSIFSDTYEQSFLKLQTSTQPHQWPAERFTEQLILLDNIGVYFFRPQLLLTTNIPSASTSTEALAEADIAASTGDVANPTTAAAAAKSSTVGETMDATIEQLDQRPASFYEAVLHTVNATSPTPSTSGSSIISLVDLVVQRRMGAKIILCPQHLPKLHPKFDYIIWGLLEEVKYSLLVFVNNDDKKGMWRKSVEKRLQKSVGSVVMKRIVWLSNLKPQEYLALLSIGDLMIGKGISI